jgi:hypothetical protein
LFTVGKNGREPDTRARPTAQKIESRRVLGIMSAPAEQDLASNVCFCFFGGGRMCEQKCRFRRQDYHHHLGEWAPSVKKLPLVGVADDNLVMGTREPFWEWINYNTKNNRMNMLINKTWHSQTWGLFAKTPEVRQPNANLPNRVRAPGGTMDRTRASTCT